MALHPGELLPRPFDVLVAGEALGQARLHRTRELADLLAQDRELGAERRDLGLACLDDRREPLDLRLQLAQLPLARQEGMLRLARGPRTAAVEAAGRAEDLATRRDVRRDHAVTAPELLGDGDLAEKMMNEVRSRRADMAGDPAGAVVGRARIGRRRQMLERKERRRAKRVIAQIGHGRARVLEALDHHPLEPLAQHRLDRALQPGRNLEKIGDGPHNAV